MIYCKNFIKFIFGTLLDIILRMHEDPTIGTFGSSNYKKYEISVYNNNFEFSV